MWRLIVGVEGDMGPRSVGFIGRGSECGLDYQCGRGDSQWVWVTSRGRLVVGFEFWSSSQDMGGPSNDPPGLIGHVFCFVTVSFSLAGTKTLSQPNFPSKVPTSRTEAAQAARTFRFGWRDTLF